jgi:hypothetical protein
MPTQKPSGKSPSPKDSGKPSKPPSRAVLGQSLTTLAKLTRPAKKTKAS